MNQVTQEYRKTANEVLEEIDKLETYLNDLHTKAISGKIHWGHIGDLKHILAQLRQLQSEEEE